MKIKWEYLLLLLIFILAFFVRMYFVNQHEFFSSDEAYLNLRIIEGISSGNGLLLNDELSYGGRERLFPSLFYLILGVLYFGSLNFLKIVPELLISLSVLVVYFLCKEITGDKKASLITALISAFLPIFFKDTINVISVFSVAVPLLFFIFYCFLKLEKKIFLILFMVFSFIFPFIHPAAFLVTFTFLAYLFLLKGEDVKEDNLRKQGILFNIASTLFGFFIVYKKALFHYGISVIWQNAPANVAMDVFRNFKTVDLFLAVGLLSIIFGGIGIYAGIFKVRNKSIFLICSFVVVIILLLLLRLIPLSVGLIFLSMALTIVGSLSISELIKGFEKTKFFRYEILFYALLILLVFIFNFLPSFNIGRNISEVNFYLVDDLKEIKEKFDENIVILGNVHEGNLINYFSGRKNVLDSSFLLAPNPVDRLKDAEAVYNTAFDSIALKLIKKYDIKIIYLSGETKKLYNIEELKYGGNRECFSYEGDYYEIVC